MPFEDESTFSGYIGIDNPNTNHDTIKLLDSIAYNIANEIKRDAYMSAWSMKPPMTASVACLTEKALCVSAMI